MSLVTIITDASFATRDYTDASGWAGFVATEGFKRYFGDSMHVQPINNINAEVFAVVNTLHCAIDAGMVDTGDKVLIQLDCLGAIDILHKGYTDEQMLAVQDKPKKQKARIQANLAASVFGQMVSQYELTVEWRHVRGHTGLADTRSIVQDKVDRKARFHMATQAAERREERARRKAEENNRQRTDACCASAS